MKTVSLLGVCFTLAFAKPNGFYHQESHYKTHSQSYKNNELQHSNDDEGSYSRDGDLEGHYKPKVKTHSQHSEYVNPRLREEYGIGQTSSFGHLNAQDRFRTEGSIFDHNAGFQAQGAYGMNSNLRHLTQNLQSELARELQQAVYSAHRRSSAYSNVVSQSQVQQDLRELEEEVRRNITMRLQNALRSQYGNQGSRGGYSYSLLNGHLQPTANYNDQELNDLQQQIEANLLRQLENQFQTYYHTQVHASSSSVNSQHVENGGHYPAPYPAPRPAPIRQEPIFIPNDNYSPLPSYPVQVSNVDSLTTVATRVQNDLNEHLNRILEDTQRRYFSERSQYGNLNFESILAQLQQELRANITHQFENQINRSYGYGARNYNIDDLDNLKKQMETNLITKLNRDFNRQRERYFETYHSSRHSMGTSHTGYQIQQPIYPSDNYYQNTGDLSHIQRQLQEDMSRQLQAAISQNKFRQMHAYSSSASNFNPQVNYQATLQELTAELNRNLTRQLEQSLSHYYTTSGQNYQNSAYSTQLANLRSQLQSDLLRQLQQGLQQSYSSYSSWSSQSSSNYRPVRGFDQSLYHNYGGSSDLATAGEDCMYGDDPKSRSKRAAYHHTAHDQELTQQVESNEDLTQQIQTNDDLTQQAQTSEDLTQQIQTNDDLTQQIQSGDDLTQQVQTSDDLTQQAESNEDLTQQQESQSHFIRQRPRPIVLHQFQFPQYTSKLTIGPLSNSNQIQEKNDDTLVRQRVHYYEQLNQNRESGGKRITVTRYTTSGKPVQAENGDTGIDSSSSINHYTISQKPQHIEDFSTNQQTENLVPNEERDLSSGGYRRRVTITRVTSSSPTQTESLESDQLIAKAKQELENLRQQQSPHSEGRGSYTRRVTVTRYTTGHPQQIQEIENQGYNHLNGNQQTYDGNGYRRTVTVSKYTNPQQTHDSGKIISHTQTTNILGQTQEPLSLGNSNQNSQLGQEIDDSDVTQKTQDLTQQSQNVLELDQQNVDDESVTDKNAYQVQQTRLVGQLQNSQQIEDNLDLTQQTQDLIQQTQNTDQLLVGQEDEANLNKKPHFYNQQTQDLTYGKLQVGQQETDDDFTKPQQKFVDSSDLAQQIEDQKIRDLASLTKPHGNFEIKPPNKYRQVQDLTQQNYEDNYFQQQSQDLTQQTEDLTQQSKNIGKLQVDDLNQHSQNTDFEKLQVGQELVDDVTPKTQNINQLQEGQQTVDSDITQQSQDLRQQTQDLSQQTQDLTQQSQDLTQQTQDLTQQAEDVGYSKIHTRPDFTQQNQDVGYGKFQVGQQQQIDDDLTQQSQDFTQQNQDAGYGKLQVGQQQQIDDDLIQQSQDFTQQNQDAGYGKLQIGQQQQIDDDLIQESQDFNQQSRNPGYGKLQIGHPQQTDDDFIQQPQDLDISYSKLQAQHHNQQTEDQTMLSVGQQVDDADLTQQVIQNNRPANDLQEVERNSDMLINALTQKSSQNQEIGPMTYEPQPVYGNVNGELVQVGTTRTGTYGSQHVYHLRHENPLYRPRIHRPDYEYIEDPAPVSKPISRTYSAHQVHYGRSQNFNDNVETAEEIHPVELQTANVVQQVHPSSIKTGTAAVETPVEPDIEITTIPAPGFWSRLGNKIKDKASAMKEKIG